jgi:biofilm PGA synthesis N-glycosyltransferase PgaC
MILSAILVLFFLSTLIQIIIWTQLFPVTLSTRSEHFKVIDQTPGVSIVICAKNEWKNIQANLPQILSQVYPDFEVILVDDHSDEALETLTKPWQYKWQNLRVYRNKNEPGKKGALQTGLIFAKKEIVLLTDADCCPVSKDWISWMVSAFRDSTSIVIGYSPYTKETGWLNSFIRYESMVNMLHYTSFSLVGLPYMGVGRNLAYRNKILLPEMIAQNRDLLSGDDDLVVNMLANAQNTRVMLHPDSYVNTRAEQSLLAYLHQKRRHVSTSWQYKPIHKVMLGSYAISMWLHLVLLIPLLLSGLIFVPLFLYSLRFGLSFRLVKKLLTGTVHRDILLKLMILEIFLCIYYPIIALLLVKRSPEYW